MRGRITGTGMAVPEKILTNADLERIVDTTDEWIVTRTGIRERHIAAEDEALSDFAIPAVERALDMAGVAGEDVGLVICATISSDRVFPATSTQIQNHIGARDIPAFDISAACTGFTYAVSIADQFIQSGAIDTAVVVGGEVLSKITNMADRKTCVLFGDGAGAVVLQRSDDPKRGILGLALHSDGSLGDLISRDGGGSRHPLSQAVLDQGMHYLTMRGNETFKVAVRSMARVSDEVLTQCGLKHEDVSWFLPHQANLRIIKAVGQRLGVREGRTYINVDRYGNTSAASIPIALDELNRAGRIKRDDIVLFSAFGAGLTWGAGVVRW